jgi:hypothetical protein
MAFQFPAWVKNDNQCWLRDLPKHRQIQRIIDVYRLKTIYADNKKEKPKFVNETGDFETETFETETFDSGTFETENTKNQTNTDKTRNEVLKDFIEYMNQIEIDEIKILLDDPDFELDVIKQAFCENSGFYLLETGLSKETIKKYYKANKIMFEMVWLETVLENLFGVNVHQ